MGMDIYGRSPKTQDGEYFRSNIWGWGPILQFTRGAIAAAKLKINTDNWGYNDGDGLKTQRQCDKLADAMDDMIPKINPKDWVEVLPITKTLDKILAPIATAPVDVEDRAPPLDMELLRDFIAFLRVCGGFRIC